MKITQNNNGKWEIDFTIRGRRIRRVVGDSKREAEAAAATIKADIIRDQYQFARPKKLVLFETFGKEFIELHSKQNKRSWKRDETSLNNLKRFFKGKTLTSITPENIERYKSIRRNEVSEATKRPLSPATINREIAFLKTLFSKAVEWGKLDSNPAANIRLLKENNTRMRILSDKEDPILFDHAAEYLKPILIVALNTGMRRMEILTLKWENVDFVNSWIYIEDSKSGKSRTVPMNGLVYDTLRDLERHGECVFHNKKTGTHFYGVRKVFERACGEAGIGGVTFHDLRHTAASRMVEAGIDLVTVKEILGHSSIEMTMRYAHPTPENKRRAVEVLNGRVREKCRHKVDSPEIEAPASMPVSHSEQYS